MSVTASLTEAGQVSTDTASGVRPVSGTRFWSVLGGPGPGGSLFTLTFNTPVTAFGFYMTDAGDWRGRVTLAVDRAIGGTATFPVPDTLLNDPPQRGGIAFVGLVATEPANAIASIRFRVIDLDLGVGPEPLLGVASVLDAFSFDDMMVVSNLAAVLGE